jgi:hypothetical protein
LALLALVGLVVDAGRAVAARREAVNDAQQAARTGAGQLSIDALRSGRVQLDATAAVLAAEKYLSAIGQQGTAWVSGNTVHVQVAESEPTVMLQIVGIQHIRVSVVASATNVRGIVTQD